MARQRTNPIIFLTLFYLVINNTNSMTPNIPRKLTLYNHIDMLHRKKLVPMTMLLKRDSNTGVFL